MKIELLWFEGCPNHEAAEALLRTTMTEMGLDAAIHRIEVPDEATGIVVGFPGSPTIRIDGEDIEPGFQACDDCTPRCRVYATNEGLRGVPEAAWLRAALEKAAKRL
jgi:hypothetical protein